MIVIDLSTIRNATRKLVFEHIENSLAEHGIGFSVLDKARIGNGETVREIAYEGGMLKGYVKETSAPDKYDGADGVDSFIAAVIKKHTDKSVTIDDFVAYLLSAREIIGPHAKVEFWRKGDMKFAPFVPVTASVKNDIGGNAVKIALEKLDES